MQKLFLFFICIFPYTNQLKCLIRCRNFQIMKGESFENITTSTENLCQYDKRAKRCYGRIMAYYNQIKYPEYISYSLGAQKHIIEKEIEELANKNHLKFLIYFLFLIESFDTDDLIITVYILCQTSDNCALNYIKDFFSLYSQQTNPIEILRPLHIQNEIIGKLNCYDYQIKQTKECLIKQYSTCIFQNENIYQQGCHIDSNMRLEYIFMITSSFSLEKISELILCNRPECNGKSEIISLFHQEYY